MKISVGIVTRNGTQAVIRAVVSAAVSDIIVVNDDCTAAHVATLRKELPTAKCIDITPRCGLAKCWNTIVRAANHDWVVISNDDVRFDDGWLQTLERTLLECPNALHVNMAYPKNRYTTFAVHKSLIGKIGWFDERFTTCCCEDDDWHLRMSELQRDHVGRAWTAGRRDTVFAICDAVLHDGSFRDKGAGLQLDSGPNEAFYLQKWTPDDRGWWTKGKVRGHYRKMRRVLPEIANGARQ